MEVISISKYKNISYGPHAFGDPLSYVRVRDLNISNKEGHKNIQETLFAAFDYENDNSIIEQLSAKFGFSPDVPVKFNLINYGNIQLVYLVDFTASSSVCFTLLINQQFILIEK